MTKSSSNKIPERVTLKRIAEYAGVSIGAVSSVLNNVHVDRRISMATVEKVRVAVAKLGYVPNISARRLRSGSGAMHNMMLAFITSHEAPLSLVNPLTRGLRRAFDAGSTMQGMSFSLVIGMFTAGKLREMPGLLTGDHFNAAIITNTTAEDDNFLRRTHLPYPAVLVNRLLAAYNCVYEDPNGGAKAAEVLIQAKRKRLAVLHSSLLTQSTQKRVDSFMSAVNRLLGREAIEIVADRLTESSANEAMRAFLRQGGDVDGVYAVTDGLALGAYHAIKQEKLRIPADIAMIGVGDNESSPFFDPPLSYVGLGHDQLGHEASKLLLRQLGQAGLPPATVEIPVETMLRASTGHS